MISRFKLRVRSVLRAAILLGVFGLGTPAFGQATFLDNFNTTSYSNNNGTLNFGTNWVENNETTNPTSGRIQIVSNQLRFQDLDTRSIVRTLDLSGATSATLTLNYQRTSGDESLLVQLFTGSSYRTVATLAGTGSVSYNLAANEMSSASAIRLISGSGGWGSTETIFVDDVLFTVTIGPLAITGPPSLPTGAEGEVYGAIQFTASGGTGGRTWSATGLPSGMAFSSGGVLSGTPAPGTQGNHAPEFSVTDGSTTASATLILTIDPPLLNITGPDSLPVGVEGQVYGAIQFTASGGTANKNWSASGLPGGLDFSSSGVLSGTPAPGTQGNRSPEFSVTDGFSTDTVTLTLVIDPALSIIGPNSLPTGVEGQPYGPIQFVAAGGAGSRSWSANGLPPGLDISSDGVLSGTLAPGTEGNHFPDFSVTDSTGTASVTLSLTIDPALHITGPVALPAGVEGQFYGPIQFTAAGGAGSRSWTATGLPNGLAFSSGGVLSGTPAPGTQATHSLGISVTDGTGTVSATVSLSIVPEPPPPRLQITGLPETHPGAGTVAFGLGLEAPISVPLTGTLTLSFAPDPGGRDDPMVQFSVGGRESAFTIDAGTSAAVGLPQISSTGTIAGKITVDATTTNGGLSASATLQVPAQAPVIEGPPVIEPTPSGFNIHIQGYSTTLEVLDVTFSFQGTGLSGGTVTLNRNAAFTSWYGSTDSEPFGSLFRYTQPFNVTGPRDQITGVTILLRSGQGTSQPVSASIELN